MEFAGIAQNQRRVNDSANLKRTIRVIGVPCCRPICVDCKKMILPTARISDYVNSTACINHRTAVEDVSHESLPILSAR